MYDTQNAKDILNSLKTLGIKIESDTLDMRTIKKARDRLARQFHPDKDPNVDGNDIKRINVAYNYLLEQSDGKCLRIPGKHQSYRQTDRPSSERFTSSSSYRPSSSTSSRKNAWGETFEDIQARYKSDRDNYNKHRQSRHSNGYSNSGSRESQYTTGTQGRPSSERFTSSSSYSPSSSRPSPATNAYGGTFEGIPKFRADRDTYRKSHQSGHSNGYSHSGTRGSQYSTGTQGRSSMGSSNTTSSEFARESARMNEEILNARRAYEQEKQKSSDAADNLRRFLDQAQREGKIKSETGQSYFERFMPQHSNAKDRSWEKFFTSHTPYTSSSSQARM